MTTDLEDRLRRHYDRRTAGLPTRGPGLDERPKLVVERVAAPAPSRIRLVVIGAAVASLIVGLVIVEGLRTGDGAPGSDDVGSSDEPATASALQPVLRLPDSPDIGTEIPATAVATKPVDWYRLTPDLAVSWYKPPSGVSMLCWRTPIDLECIEDTGRDVSPLVVPTGGNQTLVITVDNSDSDQLDLVLDDGSVLSAPIERDLNIGWGVSRFAIPLERSVASMGNASLNPANLIAVAGATLPPSADLNEVPVTVAAGSALSYWRWFADLDVSERQTAAGGTEFCWRTPAGEGCIEHDFASPKVGLIPTDGATIVLAQPAVVPIVPAPDDPSAPKFELGPTPTRVVATLSDGTAVDAPIEFGSDFGIGWARIPTPVGVTITDARSEP